MLLIRDRSQPAGDRERRARAAARERLRLSRGDRSVPHRAGEVRPHGRLARGPEGREKGRRADGVAAGATAGAQPPIKKVIVIDPGHGGVDSGTIGVDGTMEKDVVLAEGLQAAQDTAGARLHRAHDARQRRFHPVAPARAHRALLARRSVHLGPRGFDPRSRASRACRSTRCRRRDRTRKPPPWRRRKTSPTIIAGVDLSGDNSAVAPILIDLAQRDTMNKSSHFAETAITEL